METVVVDGDVHCVSEKGNMSVLLCYMTKRILLYFKHKETSVMDKHLLMYAVGEHQF